MTETKKDILQANHNFYEAFCTQDLESMQNLWAAKDNLVCIHPGWGLLQGWDDIMRSWEGIFQNPSTPAIRPVGENVFEQGSYAFVVCGESVEGAEPSLIATNIFEATQDGWKLVHHHVSPILQITDDLEGLETPEQAIH